MREGVLYRVLEGRRSIYLNCDGSSVIWKVVKGISHEELGDAVVLSETKLEVA